MKKIVDDFIYISGLILLITGLVKLISSFGTARVLNLPAPFFPASFRFLFCIVGIIEIAVALVCVINKNKKLQLFLIAWLATNFVIYRWGLLEINYKKPCPCLGNFTDLLHIPPEAADSGMKIILAFLLIGSYTLLFWTWKQGQKKAL